MPPSPVSLPYHFDTTALGKTIVKWSAVAEALFLILFLFSLLVTHTDIILLFSLLVIVAGFAYMTFVRCGGSAGVITEGGVKVTAARVLGITSAAPEGDFPIERFESVLIEHVDFRVPRYIPPFERVYLKGRNGTPNILVGHAKREKFGVFAGELGAALKLMVEQRRLGA